MNSAITLCAAARVGAYEVQFPWCAKDVEVPGPAAYEFLRKN